MAVRVCSLAKKNDMAKPFTQSMYVREFQENPRCWDAIEENFKIELFWSDFHFG